MASIVFDQWGGGLDLRKSRALSVANALYVGNNVYITNGRAIKKRPCLTKIATLEAGTVGLAGAGGKLNTFYGTGAAIMHANALFQAHRVPHWTTGASPSAIHYCQSFNGYLYVAAGYAGPVYRHHYLDDPGVWLTATAYAVGVFRRPTTAQGFRYEVTAIAGTGTSGGAEPVWPTVIGSTVVDNAGANQITWTARTFAVTDVNCPHSRIVRKLSQKIYSAGTVAGEQGNVRFCKAADPRDWTAAGDAGFIPSGINAAGSDTVTCLGDFRGDLAIYYADSTQVWDVDSDPTLNVLKSTAENIGTVHPDAAWPFVNDLVFLAKQGIRSVSLAVLTNNLQETDVGSPIDELRGEIADDDTPFALFYPALGQWWLVNPGATTTKVYVYCYSKSGKVAAWSTFEFPVAASDVTVLANELYLRSGDAVYKVDRSAFNDDGVAPLCELEMFYQDNQAPGLLKLFTGFDCVIQGSPEIAFRYDPRSPAALVTSYVGISSDTRPGDLLPMELCATSVAPIMRHQANENFELNHLQLYYEKLGPQ